MSNKLNNKVMKAYISVISEKATVSSNIVLRGKEETINRNIADYIEKEIKRELSVGRVPHTVNVKIMENNKITKKWTYKPTIRTNN